jgi:hypothetical protein
MYTDEKVTKLLVKLNRITSLDQLKWTVCEPPGSIQDGRDDVIALFLRASYKDQFFCLYERRSPNYESEHDTIYWAEQPVFAILDNKDRVLWEAPWSSALGDLFETVRKKVANIDKLLDDLLSDENEA